MFSFLISTTGFTQYTHHCQHHNSQKSIIQHQTSCCETDIINDCNKESCCKSKQVNDETTHAKCCTEELNYYRLSELYTANDSQKKQLVSKYLIVLSSFVFDNEIDELASVVSEYNHDLAAITKIPKYLLYSQCKLEPHLI